MNLQIGEVLLANVEFHQASGEKIRPVVVVLDTGDDDMMATVVTSRARLSAHEMEIAHWKAAGLNSPSTARIHKITVFSKRRIIRHLGKLQDEDLHRFAELLCRTYCHRPE